MRLNEIIELANNNKKFIANKLSNEILLKIGISISVVILFVVSFLLYDTNKLLIKNAKWVDHTNEVVQKLNNVLILFKDAHLGQKDFLITNNEKSLANYYSTHEMIISELNIIKLLTEDNLSQQENIEKARNLIEVNFKKWDAVIELKKSNTFFYNQQIGEEESNKVVAILLAMKFDELNLLTIRTKKFESISGDAPNLLVFMASVAEGFVILFYFIISSNIKSIRKTAQEKQEAFEEAQTINEELMATTDELKESLDKINTYKIALETTKDRLLEAQEIANMGNWEWDITTNDIYWSNQLIHIFDHDPASNTKFDYDAYLGLIHPDDKDKVNSAVQNLIENNHPYDIEHRIQAKDGNIKWLIAKGKVISSEDGKPLKVIGTALEITELKNARTEEEKLVALVAHSSDFIALSDEENNIISLNPAGRKLLGVNNYNNTSPMNILDYVLMDDLAFVNEHVFPIMHDTGKWSGELNFKDFNSQQFIPVCWNVFVVKDKSGKNIGIGHIIQDMRVEKKIRYELQLKNEELSAAIEELKQAEENLMLINRDLEKRVEERGKELVVSEERFRLVSLATNDAIWDWDLQTDKLWWNEGFKTMFGYLSEQIEPGIESLHNRIHPEDKFKVLKDIRQFLASGKSQWIGEYRFHNSDGQYIHVMDRGYVMHNSLGKPYRMLGSLINISERKKLEEERVQLHEKAEAQRVRLYELLMDIPAAITIMKGRDLVFEMVNESYKSMFSSEEEDLIGKSRKKLSPFPDSDSMLKHMIEVHNTGIPFSQQEYKALLNKDGEILNGYFNILLEPVYDNDNNIDGIMTFALEVTDLVVARQEVEDSAEKLRLMFEAIPQMAWKAEPNGVHTYYNAKWYEYTGSNFQELQLNWDKFIHPEEKEYARKAWDHSIETGETYELEYRWLRASDQTYRWMLGRAMPVKSSNGAIVLWVGSCTDIHDQKLMYSDLDKKNQELVKINELLDTFVYTAAHDLKSPVINLKSLFELIKITEDPETKQAYFNTVDVAVNRLDDTISGLVEVIEVQSEDNKIAKELSFDEILETVMHDFEANLSSVNGSISADFEKCPSICYLKSYVNSIFTNLIGNAIKYRSQDKPLHIEMSTYQMNGSVVLTVKDNGIGIDLAKNGNKIFKAFNRFTRTAQGKGLGLYLIKTMVERNGGKLEVESQLNVGTSFKIYLKEYV